MSAKVTKALIDTYRSGPIGYVGDELKQSVSEERMSMVREKEEKKGKAA